MQTRRAFVKQAALLSGAAGLWSTLPGSLQQALAIEPEPGSTFLDAEHVVILMQENRSFDHCYGTLRGVRGFNDPRAISLPNGNPVWLQTNASGATYAPFHLDIQKSNVTWLGSLPHSWTNQVDARNGGLYDQWLIAKPSGRREIAQMPLTLGYYHRADIPFYYAFADAFTVCDQHFCSSLTGTTPNRLYLWTGTIREKHDATAFANVRNEEVDYGREASWTTFPERLEDLGISWKIYQNELSLPVGFEGEEEDWLANFTDNPIEWFTQFHVRFSPGHRRYLEEKAKALQAELTALEAQRLPDPSPDGEDAITAKRAEWEKAEQERQRWSAENFAKLSPRERSLHERAFCTNTADPHYHALTELRYKEGDTERTVKVPKGDIFHQFRQDVAAGKLPTVSWLVAPSNFSDHPGSAWFGAWYVSEALAILTKNPEVWKKTILILTYDENDGYFDHVPPFVPPHPHKPETGKVSAGIDIGVEYVELAQDLQRKRAAEARESAIGLGYRVPMVIASPWTRGGHVCSEVFDHTSVLQFLEVLLSHKSGKAVREPNITAWRRTVCGDLTSAFQNHKSDTTVPPTPLQRDTVIEAIHRAKFQKLPDTQRPLAPEEQAAVRAGSRSVLPRQEPGLRPSCALPYELSAHGSRSTGTAPFTLQLAAGKAFGERAAGSPFTVAARLGNGGPQLRHYAVRAGDQLSDSWELSALAPTEPYQLQVYGPNGFYRAFQGQGVDPAVQITVDYPRGRGGQALPTGDIRVTLRNSHPTQSYQLTVAETAYRKMARTRVLAPGRSISLVIGTKDSHGWYDFAVTVAGSATFRHQYAGRVETGKATMSDPLLA